MKFTLGIAGIEEDLQIMGVRRWRKEYEERAEWKKITEKANPLNAELNPTCHLLI
jgi:hypothetical protein